MGIPGSKWWAGKREGTGAPFGWRAPRTMFVLLWWVNLFGPALAQPPASRLLLKILKGQTGRVRKLAFGIDLVTVYVFVPPSTQYDRVRKLYFCVDLPQNPPVRKFSYRYERVRKLAFGIDLVTIYVFVLPSTQYARVRKMYFCVDLLEILPVRKFSYRYENGISHRPFNDLHIRTAFDGYENVHFA